jgi:hypothetical protein
METRRSLIQRIQRLVYGNFAQNDATITENLINNWINDAIGVCAKNNYVESIKMDGIAYNGNSFYTTYKGISITQDEINTYTFAMPQVPISLGRNEGVASVLLKGSDGKISFDAIPMSINQVGYFRSMPTIPNKLLYWYENYNVYLIANIPLNEYTATIRIISGGDSSSLDSVLNVPAEWLPTIVEYCVKYLTLERKMPKDVLNDGMDK